MEDGRNGRTDAIVARDRCLQAVITAKDFGEARALWRAALRYNERIRTSDPDRHGDYAAARVSYAEGLGSP